MDQQLSTALPQPQADPFPTGEKLPDALAPLRLQLKKLALERKPQAAGITFRMSKQEKVGPPPHCCMGAARCCMRRCSTACPLRCAL